MKLSRLLLLFILVSGVGISAFGQSTCQETGSASGTDASGTNVSISSFPCTGGGAITAMTLTTTNSSTYCGSWYDYTASVTHSGGTEVITICNLTAENLATFNSATIDVSTITNITVTAVDIDAYSDAVTVSVQVDITYTPPACPAATNLGVSALTSTTAMVSWDAVAGASSYNWEVVSTGSGQGVGVVSSSSGAGLTGSATGLSAVTTYDLWVQADCSGPTSLYAGPYSFTTTALTAAIPYSHDFEANNYGSNIESSIGANAELAIDATAANASSYGVRMSGATSTGWTGGSTTATETNAWVDNVTHISSLDIEVDATAESVVLLEFDLKQTYSYGSNYSWFRVVVNGTQVGNSYNPSTANADPFATQTIDLSAYAGTTFNLSLQHSGKYNDANGSGTPGGDHSYVDNISITAPSCLTPSAMAAGSITANSADLTWTASASGETDWNLEWKATADFTPGTGAEDASASPTTTPAHSLSSLTAQTTYYVYYQANCGGSTGAWVGPYTFTTACANETAPYTESFDASISACWSQSATSGGPWVMNGSFSWQTAGCAATPSDHTGNAGSFITMDHSTSPTDAAVVIETPPIDITALTTPYLKFYHFMCATSVANELYVEAWDGSAWNSVATINTGSASWEEYGYLLTSHTYSGGSLVKLRFRAEPGTGTTYYGDQALDDISIIEAPTCPKPLSLTSGMITTTSATLGWTEDGSATAWDLKVQAAGTGTPITFGTAVASTSENVTSLTANTAYEFYVRAVCGVGDTSEWAGPYTFTTLISCPEPTALASSNVLGTTADLAWTAGGAETSWAVEYGASGFTLGTGTKSTVASTTASLSGLTGSTTYQVHVRAICAVGDTSSSVTTTFTTAVTNEDCANATSISIYADEATAQANTTVVISGASSDGPAGPFACHSNGGEANDVWYSFVAPSNGNKLVISTIAGTQSDWTMVVYDACGGTAIACNDDANANGSSYMPEIEICQFEYTGGDTYYVRIFTYSSITSGNCQLYIYEDAACPAPPANNACADAAAISTDCGAPTAGTTTLATASGEANPSCDAFGTINDVFYTFNSGTMLNVDLVMTATTGTIESAVYTGACGSLVQSAVTTCATGTRTMQLRGLPQNTDYTVRLWSNPGADGDFTICMTDQTPSATVAPGTGGSCTGINSIQITSAIGNNNTWVPLVIGDDIVAMINANGNDLGATSAQVYVNNSGTVRNENGVDYLDRNFAISVATQPATAVDVRLYMLASEVTALNAADGTSTVSTLNVTHGTGGTCAATFNGTQGLITQSSNGMFNGGSDPYIEFSTSSFSTFFVHSGATALPVELSRFTAIAEGNTNVLNWETATEENNAYFDVERSTNGVDFEAIAQVEGNGTTVEVSNYNFVDAQPTTVSYYRLRQVDFDGEFAYSDVRIVKRENAVNNTATFYPVPVTDRLTIDFEATTDEDLNITVTDALGRQVINKVVQAVAGENQFNIDFDALATGTYFIKLQSNNANVIRTIVKK